MSDSEFAKFSIELILAAKELWEENIKKRTIDSRSQMVLLQIRKKE
jgi:hypothetical protein